MSIPPVIVRELRAESRNPMNWWLRVLGASIIVLVFAALLMDHFDSRRMDPMVFRAVHITILLLIWLLVPAMTADCLAREKREGTLGLLFLTPLTPREVVVGKAFIHFQRSLTLFLAAVPMMTVPLLLGGVNWPSILTAFTFELSSILLAMSAGLLASAFCKSAIRALLLAEIFAGVAILLGLLFCLLSTSHLWLFTRPQVRDLFSMEGVTTLLSASFSIVTGDGRNLSLPGSAFWNAWSMGLTGTFLLSLLTLIITLFIAARRVQNNWQEKPASRRQVWLFELFCTPTYWRSFFKRKLNRTLQANPISWLQQYSWSARLSKWSWCLVVLIFDCLLLVGSNPFRRFSEAQPWVALTLILGATFSAAGSFRQERQNGALELLLVTPLRETQIVFGRLWGMWMQLLPAASLFFFAAIGFSSIEPSTHIGWLMTAASTFVCVPVLGLFFSLRLRNFLASWLVTLLTSVFLPYILVAIVAITSDKLGLRMLHNFDDALNVMLLLQVSFTITALTLLFRNLKRRTFALSST